MPDQPITIGKKAKYVLDLTIPEWMLDLCKVNFDLNDMAEWDVDAMESAADRCFIGELHGFEGDYKSCKVCKRLASIAPHVFKSVSSQYQLPRVFNDMGLKEGQKYKALGFKPTITGLKKFLNFTADHIRAKHVNLIEKAERAKLFNRKLKVNQVVRKQW